MSAERETYSLGDLGDIKTGKTPPSSISDAFGGSTPFITPKDMDGRKWINSAERGLSSAGVASVKSSLVPKNSVAVSCIGSDMGKAVLLAQPSVTNQQINTIIIDQKRFNPEYVYYDLSFRQQEIKGMASGSATPILNKGHFSKLEISLPDKETQDEIVHIISALDDKIELNRQINQTLEQIAQNIFKSWFVDFEPVKAKIEAKDAGRDPERAAMEAIAGRGGFKTRPVSTSRAGLKPAPTDQLPPDQRQQLAATAALFPDELVESELGLIPVGWEVGKVEGILSRLSSKVRYTKDEVEPYGLIPVFEQGSGIYLGYHDGVAQFKATPENPAFIFGDHTCVMHLSCEPFDISQNVIPLKGSDRPTLWVYYAVKGKQEFQEYRRHWMELISKDVIVPSGPICQAFADRAAGFHQMLETNARQNLELMALRDTLLPKLLSGELSVGASG